MQIVRDPCDAPLVVANVRGARKEVRERAEAAIIATRAEMYDIARGVLAERGDAPAEMPDAPTDEQQQAVIEAALELAYAERPDREDVVQVAKDSTVQATAFVREKQLVSVPDTPVEIILMPEFQRGVAVAYCDSPGPLDSELATFYAVSPIPDEWTDEQVDSFLREYNTRSIHELSIHEAMPGHYTQLWHSNKYPSVLRAVLGSGYQRQRQAAALELALLGEPLFEARAPAPQQLCLLGPGR